VTRQRQASGVLRCDVPIVLCWIGNRSESLTLSLLSSLPLSVKPLPRPQHHTHHLLLWQVVLRALHAVGAGPGVQFMHLEPLTGALQSCVDA